MFKFKN